MLGRPLSEIIFIGRNTMPKIVFLGAGSTVFAKSILGDCMLTAALRDAHIALFDIDGQRLSESQAMLETLNANINQARATITAWHGVENRAKALAGADYVINAIQVGGYEPATVIDFEIPKKYGLRQTIGDTLGIGGIFRGLRTIPVMLDIARDMAEVCPDAWLLNYVNPMAIVTGAIQKNAAVKTVGLCHSVQVCADHLLELVGMRSSVKTPQWKIAGINHMAWLLEITDAGRDLYPEIKRAAAEVVAAVHENGAQALIARAKSARGENWRRDQLALVASDLVRLEIMFNFGHYVTESSEHNAEYTPYWIKRTHPELIERYNIPLDEYPRRCAGQIEHWKKQSAELVDNPALTHQRTREYGASIMEAIETDTPRAIGGNVLNTGLITNLPQNCCVEVPCLVDRNGVQGCFVGALPGQCAALNQTNVTVQELTIEAALTRRRDAVYHAAMLDPRTASELTLDEIRRLCDDLIAAHGEMLPRYR
jgi:alpha-galactosidase